MIINTPAELIRLQEKLYKAEMAFQKLKAMTKQVPADSWTPEYRDLANAIHTLGRDVFGMEATFGSPLASNIVEDKTNESERDRKGG